MKKMGFTLIELLVVVLIIGILAAVALPQYQKAVLKARAVEMVSILNSGQKAMDAWMLANGYQEASASDFDIQITPSENFIKNWHIDFFNCWEAEDEDPAMCRIMINSFADLNDVDWKNTNYTWMKTCTVWNNNSQVICDYLKQSFPDMTIIDSRSN